MTLSLGNKKRMLRRIETTTAKNVLPRQAYPEDRHELSGASAVLFLLGDKRGGNGKTPEPCLILNKRSHRVRQPGDLCCPGGGVMPALDPLLGKALSLPGFPLAKWPQWKGHLAERPAHARMLRTLFSTALRESFEEMRLIPLDVTFLGPLPSQDLVLFKRTIFPMIGWVGHQKHFYPNWEVAKVVNIPIKKLLDPANYVRYQYAFSVPGSGRTAWQTYDAPCFLHRHHQEKEVLWGATCRITLTFLKIVFDFEPPAVPTLPVERARLDASYANGARS
ncbi:MAG: CoA pyrophosphatase [Deltaproteobacteria bacterium]|nr:CoA pyrophosphatase [Deltaproteobacteria bacterium]